MRWDKRRANRGILSLGTSVEMLAHYVQCGKAMGSVLCPHMAFLRDKAGAIVKGEYGAWERIGFHPTKSDLESVRRALRNLRKQGLVVYDLRTIHRAGYITPARRPSVPD
jgi:hypothetical protein